MSNINYIIRGGTLGKDAEKRVFPSGDAVTTFSIATNKKFKDKQTGEMKEVVDWINVSVFGKPAEWCAGLKKGDSVIVTGEVLTRKYQKDGRDVYATEIRAQDVSQTKMIGKPAESAPAQQRRGAAPKQSEQPPFEDDDIPF